MDKFELRKPKFWSDLKIATNVNLKKPKLVQLSTLENQNFGLTLKLRQILTLKNQNVDKFRP